MNLFFCDMDGTLIDDNENINEINLRLIQEIGDKFIIVTGRSLPQVERILVNNNLKVDYIGGNGTFIKRKNTEVKSLGKLDDGQVKMVYDILNRSNMPYIFHTVEGSLIPTTMNIKDVSQELAKAHVDYGSSEYNYWVNGYEETFLKDLVSYFDDIFEILNKYSITKIEVFSSKDMELVKLAEKLKLVEGVSIGKSYLTNIEIMNKTASKGEGIKAYINDIESAGKGITISIGDNYNDVSMFKVTDYSFSVSNALGDFGENVIKLSYSNKEPFLIEINRYLEGLE